MDDCDLHAIVGGCGSRGEISANMADMENISRSYSNLCNIPADKLACCFSQLYEFTMGFEENLQQPNRSSCHVPSLSKQTLDTNSVSLPNENTASGSPGVLPDFVRINKPRKGKKNQNESVVKHVTAESPRSDAWAWRKYGQKPIKGSPYPRSYYRCSSSKGCSARKQVERSSLDPAVFKVTYTSEHSHPHPTRRSSSSGSIRKKRFPTTPVKPDSSTDENGTEPQSSVEWVPSPIAETTPVIDNVLVDKENLKNEGSPVKYDDENFHFMHEIDAYLEDGWFQSIEEVNNLAQQLLSVDDYFMYEIYDLPKS